MKDINIEAILSKFPSRDEKEEYLLKSDVKAAIKEIVEAVVDKCAEEASLTDESFHSMQEGSIMQIDKESILKVKEMISY